MIELNLLPDVKQDYVRAQRLKRVIISSMILLSLVSVGVTAVLGFYVKVGQPIRQKLADDDIADKAKQLKENKNLTRNLTLQNQLSSINQLHEQKTVLSRWLDFLSQLNPTEPNNATMSSLAIDSLQNTITFDATVKDYKAIAVLSDTLQNAQVSYIDKDGEKQKKPLFTEIAMSQPGASKSSEGKQTASAKFTLAYEPEAVAWTTKNPTVSVPNKNTTPSASRVSIFSDKPIATPATGGQ